MQPINEKLYDKYIEELNSLTKNINVRTVKELDDKLTEELTKNSNEIYNKFYYLKDNRLHFILEFKTLIESEIDMTGDRTDYPLTFSLTAEIELQSIDITKKIEELEIKNLKVNWEETDGIFD